MEESREELSLCKSKKVPLENLMHNDTQENKVSEREKKIVEHLKDLLDISVTEFRVEKDVLKLPILSTECESDGEEEDHEGIYIRVPSNREGVGWVDEQGGDTEDEGFGLPLFPVPSMKRDTEVESLRKQRRVDVDMLEDGFGLPLFPLISCDKDDKMEEGDGVVLIEGITSRYVLPAGAKEKREFSFLRESIPSSHHGSDIGNDMGEQDKYFLVHQAETRHPQESEHIRHEANPIICCSPFEPMDGPFYLTEPSKNRSPSTSTLPKVSANSGLLARDPQQRKPTNQRKWNMIGFSPIELD
eukprot:TRINITY_DN3141_c0_g1_i1.p1 TRINITY_DN3141_c0_g1~~TRINITY_DN3141_c0_g1_i1.p1  ORF type:complete len:301 (+),score=60.94 TRINITY_DN3141_c0_g1_i1:131-1033(+)